MIQIEFAHNQEQQLIHINELSKGSEGDYTCPKCGVKLIPKVGKVKQKHFAHQENSCLGVNGASYYVPDKYVPKNLDAVGYHQWYYQHLEKYQHQLLGTFSDERKHREQVTELLRKSILWLSEVTQGEETQHNSHALAQLNAFTPGEIENLDQLIVALGRVRSTRVRWYHHVSLNARKIKYKLRYSAKKKRVEPSVVETLYDPSAADDAKLLKQLVVPDVLSQLVMVLWDSKNRQGLIEKAQARLEEIMPVLSRATLLDQMSLYYLKIDLPEGKSIFKIGITGRSMEERLKEIRYDLSALHVSDIVVIAFVPRMAHLESWYKRKFADYRYVFENHQEYFFFDHSKWFKALAAYAKKHQD